MKSLQRALQSRISRRRNLIRELEDEVGYNKELFRLTNNVRFLQQMLDTKAEIKFFADEQVLDKKLFAMGLEQDDAIEAMRRAVQISANLYLQLIDAGIEPVL